MYMEFKIPHFSKFPGKVVSSGQGDWSLRAEGRDIDVAESGKSGKNEGIGVLSKTDIKQDKHILNIT